MDDVMTCHRSSLSLLRSFSVPSTRSQNFHRVTNPEQNPFLCPYEMDLCHYDPVSGTWNLNSPENHVLDRGGTRVRCDIPILLVSQDPHHSFSEPCHVILVNLRGCAVRSPRPIPTGTLVNLHGLPVGRDISARVVNCIWLGAYEKFWLLGLVLDEVGNVWGLEVIPQDWAEPS